ncbi:heparanase-like protein 2 [Zingiber officinale]|uniref:heparanase-like protein 2 n=1 Tax=Zingiber officinale TaxID=94328 RepID=UPI001C4CFC6F|nr:heparanase-like protein 2 [Zingiber officinale]
MRSQFLFLPLFLYFIVQVPAQEHPDVAIKVKGSDLVAETSDTFVCATLDWWPREKCNYYQCPWGESSILNLNLSHPFLAKSIRAFSPLRIRVGGSLQDQVVYGMPNPGTPCLPFSKTDDGLFGFSRGCLSTSRWDEINHLFQKTGVVTTFGLNALYGRHRTQSNQWVGAWNSTNARAFIEYSISKGYNVDSWEFGNELSGQGVSASVSADQYARDLIALKAVLKVLYRGSRREALLVAPGGFFDQPWYARLLQASGAGTIDAVTHHVYNLGPGNDPNIRERITDPAYLSGEADTYRALRLTIQRNGPWSSAWVGEAGGAFNSGSRLVSKAFLNSFWYLDQLGMASKYNTKVYCRQTLIGGNYGLLDSNTFVPNPDYYSALLWHRLMGKGVLSIDVTGSSYLRAYAHCSKGKEGGVSMLLINLSRYTKFSVRVVDVLYGDGEGGRRDDGKREEYHLTAKDGNHLSQTVLLNGAPLEISEEGDVPPLNPVNAAVRSPVEVAPLSIAFVVLPDFEAKACLR